jgi:hypothetical protein
MKKIPLCISVLVGLLALLAAVPGWAQSRSKPTVIRPTNHDVSRPLRDMVTPSLNLEIPGQHEIENPRPPLIRGSEIPLAEDKALQKEVLPLVNTVPGLNFDGVGANGYAPPDTNGSVGATQYVQITNVEFAVYDKTSGNILLGPALIDTVWSGFSGDCASGNGGDPEAVWDKAAQRWVMTQINPSYNAWCMAVSTSSDATGSYNRYEFNYGSNLPDYPKLGVWPDAYYWSSNTFQNGANFIGAQVCAFDRTSMLSGGSANAVCFQTDSSVASLLPSDVDGTIAPPAGEPAFFIELLDTSDLGLFQFHVDFTTPSNSTFSGPVSIPVDTFSLACNGGTCIPQQGTTQQLDSLGDRVMFRLAYRNFSDHEALVVTHSVTAGSSVGARWYEIRSPASTPTLFQQGTFAPDSEFRWMGSAAMDQAGDIALGYSASSGTVYPAVRYTGRMASDPAGQMETEASIIEGTGSQNGGLSRWGDYSSISIDPIDDCTFWYTSEYEATSGLFNWSTRVGSFKFANCGSTAPDFYLSANPGSQTVVQGSSAAYTVSVTAFNGYSNTVAFTVSGCPTGTTCTLNPTSSGPPSYPSTTLTVATTTSTPGGNYLLTVTGTDGTITHTTSVALAVVAPDFSISATTKVETIAAGTSARFPMRISPLNSFSGKVTLTVTGLPANSTGAFSPNPVTVTSPNTATSLLTVATKKKVAAGTYVLTITGTSGTVKHSTTVTLKITTR